MLVMGLLVFIANLAHGISPAAIAAGKQATYSALVGGSIVRLCERMTLRMTGPPSRRVALATLVPTVVTTLLVAAVHSLRGTPEPMLSVLPVALLSPPAFASLSYRLIQRADESAESGLA